MIHKRNYRTALDQLLSADAVNPWLYSLALFVLTIVCRLPFMSKLLYDQDAVQFALALENYDVYLQQPHPPGYFLYVMAGKAINLFAQNGNASFLVLSVIASGLTVVAIYQLGRTLFDRETGLWAAGIAITSPLLWYYGEVALTYVVAAFFNTWIAILCWNLLQRQSRDLYLSSVVLGITGGIRQDVLIFLFPLWLFCIVRFQWKQVLTAGLILVMTVAGWFIPMLFMTGGPERYFSAVRELWYFHNRTFSVWNAGIGSRGHFLLAFLGNTSYGVGIGMIFIFLGLYVFLRTAEWRRTSREKILFFSLWWIPAFLFHILIFMNPDQAGYSVFFLPPLFVLIWPATKSVLAEIGRVLGRQTLGATATCRTWMLGLITANALFFLVSNSVVSAKGIREHDKNLSVILGGIAKNFSPNDTVVVDEKSYQLYNYRHIQYYLRRYTVYLTALSESHGERWHIFGGQNGRTFVTERIDISPRIRYVVYLTNPLERSYVETMEAKGFRRLQLDEMNALFYQVRK
jgi:4-amino-4-deoxy-L-arabinose transferase-like glycosyltransferase